MSGTRTIITFDQAKAAMEQAHAIPIMHLVEQFLIPGKADANEEHNAADHKDHKSDSPRKPLLSRDEAFSRLHIRLSKGIISLDQEAFKVFIQQLEQCDRNSSKFFAGLSSLERIVLGMAYLYGYGIDPNPELALNQFEAAANFNNHASFAVYAHGFCWILTKKDEHFDFIRRSLRRHRFQYCPTSAFAYFVQSLREKSPHDLSIATLETDIAQGDSLSLNELACSFILLSNPIEALRWFQLSAKYGSTAGACNAAHLFERTKDDNQAAFYYRSTLILSTWKDSLNADLRHHMKSRLTELRNKEIVDFEVIYHYAMAFNNSDDLQYILRHAPEIFARLWLEDYNNPLQVRLKQEAIACLLALIPETLSNQINQILADLLTKCPEQELQTKAAAFRATAGATAAVVAPLSTAQLNDVHVMRTIGFNEAKVMLEQAHAIPIMHLVEQFLNPGRADAKQVTAPDLKDQKSDPLKPKLSRNEALSRLYLRLSQRLTSTDQKSFNELIKKLEARNNPNLPGTDRVMALLRKPTINSFEQIILGLALCFRGHKPEVFETISKADEKNGYAHTLYGRFHSDFVVREERNKARVSLYDKAIQKANDMAVMAYTFKGIFYYYEQKDLISAEACFKTAAERGDFLGSHFYGKLFSEKHKTNAQKNLGAPYLERAIAGGHIESLYHYAVSFVHAEAVNWFKLGAKYGSSKCAYCTAICLEEEGDANQAMRYYRLVITHYDPSPSVRYKNIRSSAEDKLEQLQKKDNKNFDAIYHYSMTLYTDEIIKDNLKFILEHAPDVFTRLWLQDYKNPFEVQFKEQAMRAILLLKPKKLPIAANQLLAGLLADCSEPELKNKAAEFRAAVDDAVVVVESSAAMPPPGVLATHSAIQSPKKKPEIAAAAAATARPAP